MTPEAGLARPADGEDASNKAPIDPDIDLHVRSPGGQTRTQRWTLLIAIAIRGVLGSEAPTASAWHCRILPVQCRGPRS